MELVVEHLLHVGAYLKDAIFYVEVYEAEELLDTYGFYTLLDYDLEYGISHRINLARFQIDLKCEDYHAVVINTYTTDIVCFYTWNERSRLYTQTLKL